MTGPKTFIKIIAISCFITSTSCNIDTQHDYVFTPAETVHWRNYSQNDTIHFYDTLGNTEEITIQAMKGSFLKKGLFKKEKYSDFKIMIENNGIVEDLFTISKNSKSGKSNIVVKFKDFTNQIAENDFIEPIHDTISINGISISNFYRIENEEREPSVSKSGVKTIIWTDLKGLTAYQRNDNSWLIIK